MTEHLKNIQPNSKTRSELIIIRTNQSKKIKKVLEQEHISYEIYQGGEKKKNDW